MSHHTTLHLGRKTAVATLIAAAALAFTACQDAEADAAGASSPHSVTASPSAPSADHGHEVERNGPSAARR